MLKIISIAEVARRAGVAKRTVERSIADGRGPTKVQITKRRVGVFEDEYERWVNSGRCPTPRKDIA